jgi:hypothetical protein
MQPASAAAAAASPPGPPRSRRRAAWLAALALLPALPWLLWLPGHGRVPNNDYWGILAHLLTPEGEWTRDLGRWLAVPSNEHWVSVPAVLYALNAELFAGDERGLSLASLLAVAGCALLMLPALRRLAGGDPHAGWAALLLGALLFNPVQAHSILYGFSGAIWLTANLVAVAAMAALRRHAGGGGAVWLLAALALGGVGAITYSTCLSLWPALLAGALLWRLRWPAVVAVAATGATVLALYAASYERPQHIPELTTDGDTLVFFVLRYLGSLFTPQPLAAAAFGALAVGGTLALWRLTGREGRAALVPWAMLQVYALGNATGTASGRSGFGSGMAASSRYASLQALFWIGLLVPLVVLLLRVAPPGARERRVAVAAAAFLTLFTGAALWNRGETLVLEHRERGRGEALVELLLAHDVKALPAFDEVMQSPFKLWQMRGQLRAMGHLPYDRPPAYALGSPAPPGLLGPADPALAAGELRRARPEGGSLARVEGWVQSPRRVEWILLADGAGVLRGAGVTAPRESSLLRAGARQRWYGYATGAAPGELRAWAVVAGSPAAVALSPGAGARPQPAAAPGRGERRRRGQGAGVPPAPGAAGAAGANPTQATTGNRG